MSRILILGGDGYLGWPVALHFSNLKNDVTVVDNYFRRDISSNTQYKSLYTPPDLVSRAKIWHRETGNTIKVVVGDLTDSNLCECLFSGENLTYNWPKNDFDFDYPDIVIHFAEQPSAPYSQLSNLTANFTLQNNLLVTNNILFGMKKYCPEAHLIKLGTMGEYGTPNIDIEEGWIDIESKGRKDRFLFPRQGGSIYHTSKIMDTDLIWFAVRTWNLRATDLMQGPVYGVNTNETKIHEDLKTIFNYDEFFGTIINRFIAQSVVNYPLTVYGQGNQSRGYLNIIDCIQCIEIASKNPPENGKLEIFNQIMETLSVNQIALMIKKVGDDMGLNVQIKPVINPRVESENHYYNPIYSGLKQLGVEPTLLSEDIIREIILFVSKYKSNIDKKIIFNGSKW